MEHLFREEVKEKGVRLIFPGPCDVRLVADRQMMEQVFVPFFTTREGGSGIGLSLCRQIIRSHQGIMHIESEAGLGTTLFITL